MRRILIDNVDKTKEIESIKLNNHKYLIKFKSSEKYYNYSSERIKIENNNFDNNLKYFKELAEKISIVVGDYNVLGSRYKNLDNLNKDSVLNYYLKGTLPPTYRMVQCQVVFHSALNGEVKALNRWTNLKLKNL